MIAHRAAQTQDLALPGLSRLGGRVLLFESIGSTNAELLARATDLPDGAIAWAETQTAGRGRLGRRWIAAKGSSILLSILLHEPDQSSLIRHGSLLACLAAAEAIEEATDCRPRIRWPNDLTLAGRKLAGVLVESTPLAEGRRALVIGVGINCLQHRGHFTDGLELSATSLEIESPSPVDRIAVAAALVRRLDFHLAPARRTEAALDAARSAWRERCADPGEWVRLTHDGRAFEGLVLDIDREGNLLVQLSTGARASFEAATTTRHW
ncbi:MAG: biotin--[acetyl-CoA-carboxylase] ligase [Phycisphaerales bacterium]|nr:biotin--[acetyl-CoA-carboxylase] ligase [Phycisphaerales bacterium]